MLHNPLRWEPIGEEATVIGKGPSLRILLNDPGLARGPVFIASSTGLEWPHNAYAWCHLHSDLLLEMARERESRGWPGVTLIGSRPVETEEFSYFCVKTRAFPGGTSALFAAELAAGIGYKRLHVFGVDLTGGLSNFRPHWKAFHGAELIGYGESLSWLRS